MPQIPVLQLVADKTAGNPVSTEGNPPVRSAALDSP